MEKIQKIGEIELSVDEKIDDIIYRTPFIKLEEIPAEKENNQRYIIYKAVNREFVKKTKKD